MATILVQHLMNYMSLDEDDLTSVKNRIEIT